MSTRGYAEGRRRVAQIASNLLQRSAHYEFRINQDCPGSQKEHTMERAAFPPDSERSMVEFMNEHYAHSNLMYAKVYGQLSQATEARMAALDREGMELEVTVPDGTRRIRIPFEHRLQDEGDAQQTLVEMSFNARDVLAQQARKDG